MASASLPSSPPPPSPPSISASHSESTVALATSLVPQMPQMTTNILRNHYSVRGIVFCDFVAPSLCYYYYLNFEVSMSGTLPMSAWHQGDVSL
ncbi:hypothetical protein V6N13_029283 [Hibiscus sabdariffa]